MPASTPGWLRPGVTRFRQMMSPGKAAVVLLLTLFTRDRLAALEATANERGGFAAVQETVPAMQATQLLRRAVVDQAAQAL
jgi:hypothetical protein